MHDGMAGRGLLDDRSEFIFDSLIDELEFWGRIARDELAGLPLTADDEERLQFVGGWLEGFWLTTSDIDTGSDSGPDEQAALIADILTSPLGALEVATGRIDHLLVLVPDDAGRTQVALGGTYSYYEFWQDPADRLTDEQWRAMLEAGTAPQRPAWVMPILK